MTSERASELVRARSRMRGTKYQSSATYPTNQPSVGNPSRQSTASRMNWDFPYTSRRMPLLAANCVATTQPLAAQAGLSMLQRGGSAVDAAIATAIALTVVEPVNNGLGSDLFAIVWDGDKLAGLNASGRSPAAWTPDRFDGPEMPDAGWNTATVPGAVAGWVALNERFGRLPFEMLFEPAIRYARDGFQVTPYHRADLGAAGRAAARSAGICGNIFTARTRTDPRRALPLP